MLTLLDILIRMKVAQEISIYIEQTKTKMHLVQRTKGFNSFQDRPILFNDLDRNKNHYLGINLQYIHC